MKLRSPHIPPRGTYRRARCRRSLFLLTKLEIIGSKKWLTKFLNTRAGLSDSINESFRGTPCTVACCGGLDAGC